MDKVKETLDLWQKGEISTKTTGVMLENLVDKGFDDRIMMSRERYNELMANNIIYLFKQCLDEIQESE